jgi:hypothetical protein
LLFGFALAKVQDRRWWIEGLRFTNMLAERQPLGKVGIEMLTMT